MKSATSPNVSQSTNTSSNNPTSSRQSNSLLTKAIGIIGLLAIIYVHFLDLPGKLAETPYLGYGYILLMIGSAVAAGLLLFKRERQGWLLAGVLSLGALVVYAINRTVGLPMAMEDIGNWTEPLGVYSMIAEAVTLGASAWAFSRKS
jgi:uncharacterized membrane protein